MAKIQGITIDILANASGVKKALDDIQRKGNALQTDLKNINKSLKFDGNNTELLTQKFNKLKEIVANNEIKLKQLRELEKQAVSNGDLRQKEAIYREILKIENATKHYNAEIGKTEKAIKQVNSKLHQTAEKADKIGKGFTKASEKLKPLSTATAGVVVGLGAMAVSSAKTADELLTLEKNTGLSTDTIQKMKYSAELLDVPFETIKKSLAKTSMNMVQVAKGNKQLSSTYKSLGISLTDTNGKLKNNETIFYSTIDALKNVKDETERERLATELFGKSYQDVLPLVEQGSKAFQEHSKNAKGMLPKETLEKLGQFDDFIQKIKVDAFGLFTKIGSEVATFLLPILEKASSFIKMVYDWFEKLSPSIKKTIGTILLLVASLSPLFFVLGKVFSSFKALKLLFATNPFAVITLAIIGVVAALVYFYNESEEFREAVDKLFKKLEPIFRYISSFIKNLLEGDIPKAFEDLKKIFSIIWEAIIQFVTDLLGIVDKIFGTDLKEIFESFKGNVERIIKGIIGIFQGVIDFITGIFTGDFDKAFQGVIKIIESGKDLIVGILDTLINNFLGLLKNLAKIFDKIFGTNISGTINAFIGFIQDMWNKSI